MVGQKFLEGSNLCGAGAKENLEIATMMPFQNSKRDVFCGSNSLTIKVTAPTNIFEMGQMIPFHTFDKKYFPSQQWYD